MLDDSKGKVFLLKGVLPSYINYHIRLVKINSYTGLVATANSVHTCTCMLKSQMKWAWLSKLATTCTCNLKNIILQTYRTGTELWHFN